MRPRFALPRRRPEPGRAGQGCEGLSAAQAGPRLGPGLRRGSAWRVWAALLLATLALSPALADSSRPPAPLANVQLASPAQEQQAQALMASLRCVVCQGQSIADSNAEMAGDMRSLVRTRIAAGQPPETIRAWLIARYGEYVSYDPPLSPLTAPLWIAPLALFALGTWLARASFRRRR